MRETNIQSIEKRVYELEKNGGGGGTSDYSQLTNKPKIEGKTLSGNMTFEDLGIASAVDLAQTDGDLQDLADKFSPIYATDDDATLDVVLHTVIIDSNLPTNEARVFVVKCDKGWFICNAQRSTDNYTGMAIQQSGTDRYTFHGSIGGSQTIVTPFASGGGEFVKIGELWKEGDSVDITNYNIILVVMVLENKTNELYSVVATNYAVKDENLQFIDCYFYYNTDNRGLLKTIHNNNILSFHYVEGGPLTTQNSTIKGYIYAK